jgi:serine/threonine-protein kinase
MRAPIIPGRKPEETDQRAAMLRRLGIAEDRPRVTSRWDVLARDLEPAAPVQSQPATAEEAPPAVAEAPLAAHEPIPMTEALREEALSAPAVEAPVAFAEPEPQPEPVTIEDEQPTEGLAQPSPEPEPAADTLVHRPRWMDEPLAEAPRRDELLPSIDRPVGYASRADDAVANDEAPLAPEAAAVPVMEAPVARAPEPVVEAAPEPMAARQPEPAPAAPPVDAALQAMRAELEAMRKQFAAAPAVAAAPVSDMPLAAPIPYDGRRRSKSKTDVLANARMVAWTLGIVVALWFTFHALKASSEAHNVRQDHILASMTGKEKADDKADQNNDN